jgi:fructokinase
MTASLDRSPILVFGEVLVDQFPDGQRILGGAPFNVAWHLTALGAATRLVSAVGRDPDGELIRSAMSDWGMDLSNLQVSDTRPTGVVAVTFENRQPAYEILAKRAFDAIDASRIAEAACALLYHGTLALRSEPSRNALRALKTKLDAPIFMDVNLRDPWWDADAVLKLADEASWVKLNDDELDRLRPGHGDTQTAAKHFLDKHRLHGVIVTRGSRGAFALTRDGSLFEASPNPSIEVIDTVGAGDAFAAVMLLGLARGWPIPESLDRAQDFASLIVQNRGAILSDTAVYSRLTAEW